LAGKRASQADVTARIVVAARHELVHYGIRRTSVEEVARRAGVSRVSVYRRFAGKSELVRAVILAEAERFLEEFDPLWHSDTPVHERVVDGVTLGVMWMRRNELYNALLRTEPDALMLALTVEAGALFALAQHMLEERLREEIDAGGLPEIDAELAAEALIRFVHSFVVLPFGRLPGDNEDEVRAWIQATVVPLVLDPAGPVGRRDADVQAGS
jgi:AcrR family transcriptional regulator